MGVEQSYQKKQLQEGGADRASERRSYGLIGRVINYYPQASQVDEVHQHTVDVEVLIGSKVETLAYVPCFTYSHGVISKGFKKNDRVWLEYINGDPKMPIVTGYYREPTQLGIFFGALKFAVGNILDEFVGD